MERIDYKKTLTHLYTASPKQAGIITVPAMKYLMVNGEGDPNVAEQFALAVEALYTLAYTIKFSLKKTGVLDYGVMPLEGLWWCDNMEEFSIERKDLWKWTLMIMQPDAVTEEIAARGRDEVKKKKTVQMLGDIRFESYDEGACAQILHLGPYAAEAPTIIALHEFIAAQGRTRRGVHHEIYLGDQRRTAPEKLKTILRQPID
jgi:hypothetical protein